MDREVTVGSERIIHLHYSGDDGTHAVGTKALSESAIQNRFAHDGRDDEDHTRGACREVALRCHLPGSTFCGVDGLGGAEGFAAVSPEASGREHKESREKKFHESAF